MQPLLLLLAFLLAPKAQAAEIFLAVKIIGGHEVKPHSRPYMAFLRIRISDRKRCGGFLVREDFVLTAAHCWGRSITVILGAHNISKHERTQEVIPMKTAISHPNYHPKVNDIVLLQTPVLYLQLQRKAMLTAAMSLLRLPKRGEQVKPGMVCRVAGGGRLDLSTSTDTLHEVELEIQQDEQCISCYRRGYNGTTEICVGDPEMNQSTFKGDSGGPLMCVHMAQGIVSFGNKYGKTPHIEMKISSFLPWIERTMRRFQLQRPD
ncbi:granzyme H-like [Myotis yumanensis]|uniref:granzyme H-like n=1 Tax=Myotis yumanensis TaxID=159337 RepID=UPI0038CFB099